MEAWTGKADPLAMSSDGVQCTYDAVAKQYRETILEIEQIEGAKSDDDEIGEVLAQRQADGKSGTVRKNRAKG